MDDDKIKVKSLKKALEILNCFEEKQPLGVTELSERMGLYKSNVHNILSTFEAMGYVEKDKDTGKYYLAWASYAWHARWRTGSASTPWPARSCSNSRIGQMRRCI